MSLFTADINGWKSWGAVFQSVSAFAPLIQSIFEKERLPFCEIEKLTPGTNAVFKLGAYVIKLYAPRESGMDSAADRGTELFAMRRAAQLGIPSPGLVAADFILDKYRFDYLVMDYIHPAISFAEAVKTMPDAEKTRFGRALRAVTDRMNTPCARFNEADVLFDRDRWKRWDGYPDAFKAERAAYIQAHAFGNLVFVHGDLNGDNILLSQLGAPTLLDFADAVHAPVDYEHALVAVELFDFDRALLRGYFGDYNPQELADTCFSGLLIHDFGGDIVRNHVGAACDMSSLHAFRRALERKLGERGV